MKYRAFLSYSHSDQKWARWLHRKIESYRLPKSFAEGETARHRLSPIFRDREELPSSASLSEAVDHALAESESLILICSPAAVASRWVNEEVRKFRELGKSDRIFCFIVDGEPFSGDANECFPAALIEPASANGSSIEPLAADARPECDGRTDALLKIIAGMLGVGFDALKQRHQVRHYRQMVMATTASLLIAVLTITLAAVATVARRDAELQREQAENLINFMLGDLQEQLRAIGRLDLHQSIGDKAMGYFESLRGEDVSDHMLSQRAENLRQIGEVRLEQGRLADALVAFEEAHAIALRVAKRNPTDVEIQLGLVKSYSYVGAVHWQRGDLTRAQQQFENAVAIAGAVSAANPDNTDLLVELGYTYTNLGRVLELEGEYAQAISAYRRVMEINQRLVELEPEEPEWMLELGFAHNNLGKVQVSLGQFNEAEVNYRSDLALKLQVLETDPEHKIRLSYVAVSEFFLGRLLASTGQYDEAETLLVSSRRNFEALTRLDPQKVPWQLRLANSQRELGQLWLRSGRRAQGLFLLEKSVASLNDLSGEHPSDVSIRRELARGLLMLSEDAARGGRPGQAEVKLQRAREEIAVLIEKEPTSRETQQLRSQADLCEALVAAGPREEVHAL